MNTFRIHGDNIVECERIVRIIMETLAPERVGSHLVSPSVIVIELQARYLHTPIAWRFELLPGFNKNTKRRWTGNIFDGLKEVGSFFDETPDAIITEVDEEHNEKILLAIEFCSALQAGNQAWQRSARAFSAGRTGCPYLYIVDFVKYELNNKNRSRKNLRFPNAAVPYSYINYAKNTGHFVVQLYTKSEEFDRSKDASLRGFDEADFGSAELGVYLVKRLMGADTHAEEQAILRKSMNVIQFLAGHKKGTANFTANEWQEIHDSETGDIVEYAVGKNRFGFRKTITAKSHHGASRSVVALVKRLGVGLASEDLPLGIIPADHRPTFAEGVSALYPAADPDVIQAIGNTNKHLIIAMFKGFKPKGDDNRPDRGLLPLAAMLSSSDVDIMSYIYGPMIEANLKLLDTDPYRLAARNGLWRSILSLSEFVVLDVPVLARESYGAQRIYNTGNIKESYKNFGAGKELASKPAFSNMPVNFGEDDVDTGIHYLFTHLLRTVCFEGMCNPPGGDWSGFSVIEGEYENRWLSLPRVSDVVSGKRPDHIIEMFGAFEKPLLLSIESKERSVDLEEVVGTKLVAYIHALMGFVPSAKRNRSVPDSEWQWGDTFVDFNGFETISAAAYLKKYAEMPETVFEKKCEMLFVMDPVADGKKVGWEIEILPSTKRSETVKQFIIDCHKKSGDKQFVIK